jgi:hypothetical protein
MKSIFYALLGLLMFSGLASADIWSDAAHQAVVIPIFALQSTTKTSSVIDVSRYRVKSLTVQGYAVAGHTAASLSGTLAAYCGPTSSGPFVASTGLFTTAVGGAISTTSNATLNFESACSWMEFIWTKTSGEVSVWLGLGN